MNADVETRCRVMIQAGCALRDGWRLSHDALLACGVDPSPETSGLGRCANATEGSKQMLRDLIRNAQEADDASLTLWQRRGRRSFTWRRFRDDVRDQWRKGKAECAEVTP
jgi:hypothetical protein